MKTIYKPQLIFETKIEPLQKEIQPPSTEINTSPSPSPKPPEIQMSVSDSNLTENWPEQLKELETYFTTLKFPSDPIKLDSCTTITFLPKFVKTHLSFLKENINNLLFLPYLNRLQDLKNKLISNL